LQIEQVDNFIANIAEFLVKAAEKASRDMANKEEWLWKKKQPNIV
jgi:hypothetical protein